MNDFVEPRVCIHIRMLTLTLLIELDWGIYILMVFTFLCVESTDAATSGNVQSECDGKLMFYTALITFFVLMFIHYMYFMLAMAYKTP